MFSFKTDKPKQPKQLSLNLVNTLIFGIIYHYDGQVVLRPYMFPVWEKRIES